MARHANTLRRTRAMIMKEFKHILFDPGFLFLTLFAPAVMLTLLSYVFSFDVDSATIAVLNNDRTPQSYAYLRNITADGAVEISQNVATYDDVLELFRRDAVDAALVIPPGFGEALASNSTADVQVLVDGSDAIVGLSVSSGIQQRTAAYTTALNGSTPMPFDARIRVWFNENLSSQYSMVPGLMSLVLILPAMAAAMSIARDKETGTFETLVTTPVRGHEYMLGKQFVYLVMGIIGGMLALAVAVLGFGVPFRGSVWLYILFMAVYLFALLGLSLLIANFIPSQRTVTVIILLVLFVPGFFLTGLLLPIDETAMFSRVVSFALPGTHFIDLSRGVALKAGTLASLGTPALVLFGMGLLSTVASILLFKKKI